MTTETLSRPAIQRFAPAYAFLIGLFMVALAGHVQATTLHDAAHDVRHATGFPCH